MYPPSTSRPNLTSPRMHYFERGHPGSRGGHSCVQPMFTNLDFAESQQRRRSTGGWFALRRNTQFFPFLSFSSFFLLQASFGGKLIPMVSLFWVLRVFFITKLFLSFFFLFGNLHIFHFSSFFLFWGSKGWNEASVGDKQEEKLFLWCRWGHWTFKGPVKSTENEEKKIRIWFRIHRIFSALKFLGMD